jgi:hypothetical protein
VTAAQHLNLVLSNPAEGHEEEYRSWYGDLHLRDCVEGIEGYVAARHYRLADVDAPGRPAPWSYVAAYELETESLPRLYAAVQRFRAEGTYERPAGRVAPGHTTWVYSASERPVELTASSGVLCLCFTNAHNAWYDAERAGAATGVRAAVRYRRSREQRLGVAPPWEHLCAYDLEPEAVDDFLRQRAFDALGDDHAAWVFVPASERLTRPATTAGAAAR